MSFREDVDALNARFLAAVNRRDAVGACIDTCTDDAVLLASGAAPIHHIRRVAQRVALKVTY